jgi:hypothetical protein
MLSAETLSSLLACFSVGTVVGLGAASAFGAGWDVGVAALGGKRATSLSPLQDDRNATERLRLTSRVRDMMLFLCWMVVIVRPW